MDSLSNSNDTDVKDHDSYRSELNDISSHPDNVSQKDGKASKLALLRNKKAIGGLFAAVFIAIAIGSIVLLQGSSTVPQKTGSTSEQQVPKVQTFGITPALIEGLAEYSTDGATWKPLVAESELSEGSHIKTGGDGRVVLLIDDGSAVRLSYSTEIELVSLATADVRINTVSGEVYSRVVASEDRKYGVMVGSDVYEARGTAYRIINKETKKGVEVFHSSVEMKDKDTLVSEGSGYFTLLEQKDKENVISPIDLEALKSDEFIKWNALKDKETTEFADKLGVLVDIDKVVTPPPPPPAAPKPTTTSGIVLKGSQSEYAAVFSWTVTGVDVSNGFKLVRSSKTNKPVYPDNSVAYIKPGSTSYTHYDSDGGSYNYRICAYRDGTCESYSNAVSVTTKKKEKPAVEAGAVTLSITGNVANWTYAGTAPYGFKLVASTTMGPTYPGADFKTYTDSTSAEIMDGLTSGSTYYIRVCKYTDGGCQDYSNELTYIAP